jgi:hypothetical protein
MAGNRLTSMKRSFPIFIFLIFFLASCEKETVDPQSEPEQEIDNQDDNHDYLLKIGSSLVYDYNEIEMYDSSTHILYFKDNHPEFEETKNEAFAFFVNGDTVYMGYFWPMYFSSMPPGPYIANFPLFYRNYALRIDKRENFKPDPRNDPRLIEALKGRNLLHSGLSVKINSIDVQSSQITFTFSITNKDQSALLILDPEKMGLNLFHYFTNGLVIQNIPWTGTYITVKIPHQTPSPWNGWKIEWLSRIAKGEIRTFVINYPLDSPLGQGEYRVSFEYPGLHYQISKDDLVQGTGRIWLGSLEAAVNIVVD